MTTATETPITAEVLQSEALELATQGKAIIITDQEGYDKATSFLTERLNPWLKKVDDFFDPNIKTAHKLHKDLVAQKKTVTEPNLQLKGALNGGILGFDERKEQERIKLQRVAEEAQRKADEESRLATAVEMEKAGATEEEVQQTLNTPVATIAPVVAPVYQKASGVAVKVTWSAQMKGEADGTTYEKSMRDLCAAIGCGDQPVPYCEPNLTALSQIARAQHEAMNIPGVKAVATKSVSSGTH